MELKEEDSAESSEENEDWGIMISRFMKNYPSMTLNDILELSYPQFKILYMNIYDDKTFSIVIPYLGSSSEDSTDEATKEVKQNAKESNIVEISSIVSAMNKDFMSSNR